MFVRARYGSDEGTKAAPFGLAGTWTNLDAKRVTLVDGVAHLYPGPFGVPYTECEIDGVRVPFVVNETK